jgi:hypothetical protein
MQKKDNAIQSRLHLSLLLTKRVAIIGTHEFCQLKTQITEKVAQKYFPAIFLFQRLKSLVLGSAVDQPTNDYFFPSEKTSSHT